MSNEKSTASINWQDVFTAVNGLLSERKYLDAINLLKQNQQHYISVEQLKQAAFGFDELQTINLDVLMDLVTILNDANLPGYNRQNYQVSQFMSEVVIAVNTAKSMQEYVSIKNPEEKTYQAIKADKNFTEFSRRHDFDDVAKIDDNNEYEKKVAEKSTSEEYSRQQAQQAIFKQQLTGFYLQQLGCYGQYKEGNIDHIGLLNLIIGENDPACLIASMRSYEHNKSSSRTESYRFLFGTADSNSLCILRYIANKHGNKFEALAEVLSLIKVYLENIKQQECLNSGLISNTIEKTRNKTFIRLLVTWWLKQFNLIQDYTLTTVSVGNTKQQVICKADIIAAIHAINNKLTPVIYHLRSAQAYHARVIRQNIYLLAQRFMKLPVIKEYQRKHHVNKIQLEFQIIFNLINSDNSFNLDELLSRLDGGSDAAKQGKMKRSKDIAAYVKQLINDLANEIIQPMIDDINNNMLTKPTEEATTQAMLNHVHWIISFLNYIRPADNALYNSLNKNFRQAITNTEMKFDKEKIRGGTYANLHEDLEVTDTTSASISGVNNNNTSTTDDFSNPITSTPKPTETDSSQSKSQNA